MNNQEKTINPPPPSPHYFPLNLFQAASSGVTVCATVHSPTAEAFSLFDSLLLLSRGRAVLCGPTQAALGAARVL